MAVLFAIGVIEGMIARSITVWLATTALILATAYMVTI